MKETIKVVLNNGKKTINVKNGTTIREIILNNADVCEYKIIGAKLQNKIVDFNYALKEDTELNLFDLEDIDGYKMTQAGLKFVLLVALKETFGKKVGGRFKHSMGNGIYATIEGYDNFSEDDLNVLKQAMDDIIKQDLEIKEMIIPAEQAFEYYTMCGMNEKAMNVHNISMSLVFAYRLKGFYDYFFCKMPVSTSFINDFELIYIGKNEFAVVLPINHTYNLVEYKHYDKITECFNKHYELLNYYNLSYICDINNLIANGNAKYLIKLFESSFNNELYNVANKIVDSKAKFILVSGPSSSGKTTTCKRMALTVAALGKKVTMISTDDYFFNLEDSPKLSNGKYDFESIKCVDIEKLNQDLIDLVNGKEVVIPTYNFKKGKREYNRKPITLDDDGIIFIEGIHCLNDELTPNIKREDKYKVYLSPFMPAKIDRHNYISTTDLRLIRRIIRDNNNRATNIDRTLELWNDVRKGEEKNIFPYVGLADIIVNTALPYELGVLKVFVEPLLYSVDESSKYYEEAKRLIRYLEFIYPISPEYVDNDSIIREFIGGSFYKGEGDI